jgi:hypothetical protein
MMRNRIAWTYTDDTGFDWRVGAMKALTDQNKLGGSPAGPTVPPLPPSIKPRRIQLRYVRGQPEQRRSIVVYSVPCPIMTPGATVTLNVRISGTDQSQVYTNVHRPRTVLVPERHPRKLTSTNQPG